jgi:hypothetical protein
VLKYQSGGALMKLKGAISAVNLVLCLIGSATAGPEARAECLSSAKAVWAVHPGSHPNWRLRLPGHVGEKCWYAKNSTNLPAPHVQEERVLNSPRRTESELRTDGQAKQASNPLKASATDRPDERPARSESRETLGPTERAPSSILIWGRRMQIDATWEEIFARRERGAK